MQYRFFRIPADGCAEAEEALNRFLRGVRVLRVDRQFVGDGQGAFWSLCVECLDSPKAKAAEAQERKDYKALLPPDDFALFAALRELRKVLAAEDGVPVYAVCTNDQLADLGRLRPTTAAGVRKVEGLGQAKAERYGARFAAAIAARGLGDEGAAGRPPV